MTELLTADANNLALTGQLRLPNQCHGFEPPPTEPYEAVDIERLRGSRDQFLAHIEDWLPAGHYWYLAGPMTGYDSFNYPEFDRIAQNLRRCDYQIVTPSEFENWNVRDLIHASDGTHKPNDGIPTLEDCIARDIVIVANPRCIGVIVHGRWEASRGAKIESYVGDLLGKPLYLYEDLDGSCGLKLIDRDEALIVYDARVIEQRSQLRKTYDKED